MRCVNGWSDVSDNTAHKIRKYIVILMINISVAGQANIHQEKGLALTD
jgi:hypothetical protein